MDRDWTKELAALTRLGVSELRTRYAELFGEPTRTGNKTWLVRRIAWRLQALAEGELSERARRRAEELARDADLRLTAVLFARGFSSFVGGLSPLPSRKSKRIPGCRFPFCATCR